MLPVSFSNKSPRFRCLNGGWINPNPFFGRSGMWGLGRLQQVAFRVDALRGKACHAADGHAVRFRLGTALHRLPVISLQTFAKQSRNKRFAGICVDAGNHVFFIKIDWSRQKILVGVHINVTVAGATQVKGVVHSLGEEGVGSADHATRIVGHLNGVSSGGYLYIVRSG